MRLDRKTIEIGSFSIILLSLVLIYGVLGFQRNSRWADEYTLWEDALIKSPSKSRPYIYTGVAYAKDKRFKEAYSFLSKAVILNPTDIEARYNLSILYVDLKRYDLAEGELKRAIQIRPNLKGSYIALSEVYSKQNRFIDTAKTLKRAFSKWPNSIEIGLKLATANAQSGKLKEAEAGYKWVLTRRANNTEALGGLGNIYMLEGRPTEALALYEQAIELSPGKPEPIYNAALVLDGLGNNKRAVEYYTLFIRAAETENKSYTATVKSARERIIRLNATLSSP